jgi:predicted nucleotidyltransferase
MGRPGSRKQLDWLEAVDFDMRLAGAELLGLVASICDTQILNRERLAVDMVRTSTYAEATPFVQGTLLQRRHSVEEASKPRISCARPLKPSSDDTTRMSNCSAGGNARSG